MSVLQLQLDGHALVLRRCRVAWPAERADELEPAVTLGLRHLGVDAGDLDAAVGKAMRALRLTLGDDTGRWILGHHSEAYCEWPLTVHDEVAGHYVIDRTFVDDSGFRWIIDYKTGEHLDLDRDDFLDREQARYREQLENYARIVRLLETRPIRLALYFPLFADWRGDLFAAGLSSNAIVRIEVNGDEAKEAERYAMGARIRSLAQGPDGALWVLEDERAGSQGRLLKLTPKD